MAAKKPDPTNLAYEAGRRAFETEPPDRRTPDACPFDPRHEGDERAAWLDGFEAALDDATHPDDLRKALKEAR